MAKHLGVSQSTYFKWKREMELPYVSASNKNYQRAEKPEYYFSWASAKQTDFILNNV